jgi:hypothetical protein
VRLRKLLDGPPAEPCQLDSPRERRYLADQSGTGHGYRHPITNDGMTLGRPSR